MYIKKTNNGEYYYNNVKIPNNKNGTLLVEFPDGTQNSVDYISDNYELFAIINHHGMKIRVPVENLNVIKIKGIN